VLNQGGIYQRLAVGKTAVSQPGAAFMFAKNANGKMEPETATAVKDALTVTNFQKDETGDKLSSMIFDGDKVNDGNLTKLRTWMKESGYENVRTNTFLRGAKYAEARKKALEKLSAQPGQ